MTRITLKVNGAQAWAVVSGPLTAGMVGLPVTIEYDGAWEGLTKNLVCRCSPWGSDSAQVRTILNVEQTAVVAHEVMLPGQYLYLGLEGFSGDGKLVMPTTWAMCGRIDDGADSGADPSTEPELAVWSQLQEQIGQLKREAVTQERMASAVEAAERGRRPRRMVSLIDDDCRDAVVTRLEPVIEEKGVPYTLACPPGNIGGEGYMALADLRRLIGKGVTIANHMYMQTNMDQFATEADFRADIEAAQAMLDGWGIRAETMCYPQGVYVDAYLPAVRDNFRMGFTINPGINQLPYASCCMDRVNLFVDDASDDGSASLEAAKQYVNELAGMESGWLVFMTHAWYGGFHAEKLGELIDYIRDQGIEIVDVHEAIDTTGNITEVGVVKKPLDRMSEPFYILDAAGRVHTNALTEYAKSGEAYTELVVKYNTGVYLKPAGGRQDHDDVNRIVSLEIPVQPGEVYVLYCSAVWGGLAYCIYNSEIGAAEFSVAEGYAVANTAEGEVLTDHRVVIPEGATYMRVSSNLTYQPGGYKVYRVQQVPGTDAVERARDRLEGKVMIALGDNYTQGMDSELRALAAKYGMILDNRGVSASSVCGDIDGNKGSQPMWLRADGIAADYTADGGYAIGDGAYHAEDVGIITFMGGVNDGFGQELWIGTGPADMDTGHIYGAMNHIYSTLMEAFPGAEVITILQPSSWNHTVNTNTDPVLGAVIDDDAAQRWGFKDADAYRMMTDLQLSSYAMMCKEEAIRRMAWVYGSTVVDAFGEFPTLFHPANRAQYWQTDKLNLSAKGCQLLADMLERDGILAVFGQ